MISGDFPVKTAQSPFSSCCSKHGLCKMKLNTSWTFDPWTMCRLFVTSQGYNTYQSRLWFIWWSSTYILDYCSAIMLNILRAWLLHFFSEWGTYQLMCHMILGTWFSLINQLVDWSNILLPQMGTLNQPIKAVEIVWTMVIRQIISCWYNTKRNKLVYTLFEIKCTKLTLRQE